MQYGTSFDAKDAELWGDDDILHGGTGDGTDYQYFFAGDGNDEIYMGDSWRGTFGFGHGGNDKIYLPNDVPNVSYFAGAGNDRVYAVPVNELGGLTNGNEYGYGGSGNDYIQGSNMLTGDW